jgi:uncharacterized membrane protein
LIDHQEYERIAKELLKRTPPQRVDYEIRARAERMVVDVDVEELWKWAKANSRHVDRELGDGLGEGSVVGLFRRALQTAHQDQIRTAVRIEERERRLR